MTEPSNAGLQRRLELFRHRRAARAADRAAFEACRQHGLKSRHEAKLARLAATPNDADADEELEEVPTTDPTDDEAA